MAPPSSIPCELRTDRFMNVLNSAYEPAEPQHLQQHQQQTLIYSGLLTDCTTHSFCRSVGEGRVYHTQGECAALNIKCTTKRGCVTIGKTTVVNNYSSSQSPHIQCTTTACASCEVFHTTAYGISLGIGIKPRWNAWLKTGHIVHLN